MGLGYWLKLEVMSRSRVKVKGQILVRVRVGVKFGLLLG